MTCRIRWVWNPYPENPSTSNFRSSFILCLNPEFNHCSESLWNSLQLWNSKFPHIPLGNIVKYSINQVTSFYPEQNFSVNHQLSEIITPKPLNQIWNTAPIWKDHKPYSFSVQVFLSVLCWNNFLSLKTESVFNLPVETCPCLLSSDRYSICSAYLTEACK
jgi:hypothetical protein